MVQTLLLVQGIYYGVFAIWPLVHMPSFLAVSGPKVDLWLVRTVSWLLLVSSGALLLAALRGESPGPEILFLAIGIALALGAVDVYYVQKRRIWRTYLLDALVEGFFILWWGLALLS